jgi:hypothetical protein
VANVDAAIKGMEVGIESVKAQAAVTQGALNVEVAQTQVGVEAYRAQGEVYKAQMQKAIAKYGANLKKWEATYQIALKKQELRVEATKAAAQISAQLAASALAGFHVQSGLNGSASLGMTGQTAGHWNYNYGENHQFTGE